MPSRSAPEPLTVGGLTPMSTIDFPGKLSAVLFLQGCPWRCRFCHNGGLIPRSAEQQLGWGQVIEFLLERRGFLDAVVFSGGEPTLQRGLEAAVRQVKQLGFAIGLHTAGIYPGRLGRLLPLLDWIGLDVKTHRADYSRITGVRDSADRVWHSIELIQASGVPHEFRTTVHPDLLSQAQLLRLRQELIDLQAGNLVIQECVDDHCLDPDLRQSQRPRHPADFYRRLARGFDRFEIRAV